MISRRKGLTYGLILAGSLGLLAPQAIVKMRARKAPQRALVEVSNLGSWSVGAAPPTTPAKAGEELGAPAASRAQAAEPEGEAPLKVPRETERYRPERFVGATGPPRASKRLADLDGALLDIQKNFMPSDHARELGDRSKAWNFGDDSAWPDGDVSGASDEAPTGEPSESGEDAAPIVFERLAEPMDNLVTYLGQNALTGIMITSEESAALLGGRILRVGTTLPEQLGTVVAIEREAILIGVGEVEVRVELPPVGAAGAPEQAPSGAPETPAPTGELDGAPPQPLPPRSGAPEGAPAESEGGARV